MGEGGVDSVFLGKVEGFDCWGEENIVFFGGFVSGEDVAFGRVVGEGFGFGGGMVGD